MVSALSAEKRMRALSSLAAIPASASRTSLVSLPVEESTPSKSAMPRVAIPRSPATWASEGRGPIQNSPISGFA